VITEAGTGSWESQSNELSKPWGIFVDIDFNLYVADTGNNRIQRFQQGQLNGTTVAGNRIPNNLTLNHPTDVIVDADGFLYIADNDNHRIIRAGPNEFQCIAGCTGKNGSASNELKKAYALRFDSDGNLYVADEFNDRIQKFSLATNSCGKYLEKTKYENETVTFFENEFSNAK
jgi:sugar lactone lactonase YvrE